MKQPMSTNSSELLIRIMLQSNTESDFSAGTWQVSFYNKYKEAERLK